MDPSFLMGIAHTVQQNQIVKGAATQILQEQDEKKREEKLLEYRRDMLITAFNDSEYLLHQVNENPQKVFVQLHLLIWNMDHWKVIPDSLPELKEKEDTALLWRRLISLEKKCRDIMVKEQIDRCQDCLNAIAVENTIRTLSGRLEPYQNLQEIKPKIESAQKKNRKVDRYRKIGFRVLAGLTLISFVICGALIGFQVAWINLPIWLMADAFFIAVGYIVFECFRPRGYKILENQYEILSRHASIDDEDFWNAVSEYFGGIPTTEQLHQSWNEQEEKIQAIFGKPEPIIEVTKPDHTKWH